MGGCLWFLIYLFIIIDGCGNVQLLDINVPDRFSIMPLLATMSLLIHPVNLVPPRCVWKESDPAGGWTEPLQPPRPHPLQLSPRFFPELDHHWAVCGKDSRSHQPCPPANTCCCHRYWEWTIHTSSSTVKGLFKLRVPNLVLNSCKDMRLCRSALFCGHKCSLGPWLRFCFHNFQDLHLVCCTDLQSLQQKIPIKHHHLIQIHTYIHLIHTSHTCTGKVATPRPPGRASAVRYLVFACLVCQSDSGVSSLTSVLENMCGQGSTVGGEGHHRQSEGPDQSGSVSGYLPRLRCRWVGKV